MSLEEIRTEFYTALEGLKEVHTKEDLEEQKKKINVAKKRLLAVDEEFVAMIEENERKSKMRSEQARAEYRSNYEGIQTDAMRKSEQIINKAKLIKPESLVITQGANNVSFEALKEKVENKLVCPICKEKDRGNILNDKPTCFKCMHLLVPESDLKKYNRKYRRKWKRSH